MGVLGCSEGSTDQTPGAPTAISHGTLVPTLRVGMPSGTLCVPAASCLARRRASKRAFPRGAWERGKSSSLEGDGRRLALLLRLQFEELCFGEIQEVGHDDVGEGLASGVVLHHGVVVRLPGERHLVLRGG